MLSYCKIWAKYEISNQPGPLQETTFLPDTVFICFEEFQTKRWLLSYIKTLTSDVEGGWEEGWVVSLPRKNIKFHTQAHAARIYMAYFLPLVYYKVVFSHKLFYFTDQKFVCCFITNK
jgi:hypothetical protein